MQEVYLIIIAIVAVVGFPFLLRMVLLSKGKVGEKHSFYNPILQNGGHIRMLRKTLQDFGELPFFSIVTFSEQADLKINVSEACVIYWNQILPTIRRFSKERLTTKLNSAQRKKKQSGNTSGISIKRRRREAKGSTKFTQEI